jgi:signal peptidase II
MKAKKTLRTLLFLTILGVNIGCDQVSKTIVRQHIDYGQKIELVKNHLTLTKVENTGAFLSLGNSLPDPLKLILLTILPLLMLGFAFLYLLKMSKLSRMSILGICFVAGGGVGNVYDRIIYGSVTDFLHIDFGIFQTGIFNMADVSILAGSFIILLENVLQQKTERINTQKD